ncbi:MAG: ribonuclease R [Spirochaetales bacterium]|uniref:exoribonuclease II n=1 Tax=Candidatus Thalassospirochaeta sargassi TaxID=3119039 RepID=A0AAJ1ICW1_9SPIO|nr:ribonuclease R [Spirochaetales bacterium]
MNEQNIIKYLKNQKKEPVNRTTILSDFGGHDEEMVTSMLDKLLEAGEIVRYDRMIGLPEQFDLVSGILRIAMGGFGFIKQAADGDDLYVPAKNIGKAFSGDTVLAKKLKNLNKSDSYIGKVIRVTNRAKTEFVGTYRSSGSYGFVTPDDRNMRNAFFISDDKRKGAVTDQKVVVKLLTWRDGKDNPEGEITQVLGHKDAPGMDITALLRRYEVSASFPEEVETAAAALSAGDPEIDPSGRQDFRDLPTVTIDSESTTVRDDAISAVAGDDGSYRLYAHIADPLYYLSAENPGPMFDEAEKRGRSIYLPGTTVPMLPSEVCEHLGSLNPGVDRPAMSVIIEIDKQGNSTSVDVVDSIIRSDGCVSYRQLSEYLEGDKESIMAELKDAGFPADNFEVEFLRLRDAATLLRENNIQKGRVEFSSKDFFFEFDENGKAIDIQVKEQGIAERIVSEFMLAANESVAEYCRQKGIPCLYRTQAEPNESEVARYTESLNQFDGLRGMVGEPFTSGQMQAILKMAEDCERPLLVERQTLKLLRKAEYSVEPKPHFSLATSGYCQFTSPLRRFSDLVIHRSIRLSRLGSEENKWFADAEKRIEALSEVDRTVNFISKEAENMKKAEYMSQHIGEEFQGIIVNAARFGLTIELENSVRGLVPVKSLKDDFYQFDPETIALTGKDSRKSFTLGDPVSVITKSADTVSGEIVFEIVNHD